MDNVVVCFDIGDDYCGIFYFKFFCIVDGDWGVFY